MVRFWSSSRINIALLLPGDISFYICLYIEFFHQMKPETYHPQGNIALKVPGFKALRGKISFAQSGGGYNRVRD